MMTTIVFVCECVLESREMLLGYENYYEGMRFRYQF